MSLRKHNTRKTWWQVANVLSVVFALALPLAAGVLSPIGFTLSPAVGAVLMSLSTMVVALNAQLLRKTNL